MNSAHRCVHAERAWLAGLLFLLALASARAVAHPPDSFRDIAKAIGPSVVTVEIVRRAPKRPEGLSLELEKFFDLPSDRPGDGPGERRPSGTGIVIDGDGHVLTEHSVVSDAAEIHVVMQDGESRPASLVGLDESSSVALLKVAGVDLVPAPVATAPDLAPGDWVMAVGAPLGLHQTISVGVISALARQLGSTVPGASFIQSDVEIQPGSGGGPLVDRSGRVVGMAVAIMTRSGRFQGVSFFIDIREAMRVAYDLRRFGRVPRGWLGVQISDLTERAAAAANNSATTGVLINGIEPGSPADRAALAVGDAITKFDGQPVRDANDLLHRVMNSRPGQQVRLEVWRESDRQEMTLTFGEAPDRVAD